MVELRGGGAPVKGSGRGRAVGLHGAMGDWFSRLSSSGGGPGVDLHGAGPAAGHGVRRRQYAGGPGRREMGWRASRRREETRCRVVSGGGGTEQGDLTRRRRPFWAREQGARL